MEHSFKIANQTDSNKYQQDIHMCQIRIMTIQSSFFIPINSISVVSYYDILIKKKAEKKKSKRKKEEIKSHFELKNSFGAKP